MKIGIASQVTISAFKSHLYEYQDAPNGLGGTSVNLLVLALLEQGEQVVIYTLDRGVDKPITLRGERLTIHIGKYRRRLRQIDFFRAEAKQIQKMILADPPDIVHAHWTYEFALGALWSKIPTVITVRDWAPVVLNSMRNNYRLVRLLMNNWVFRSTRNFISNSHYIQKLIEKKYSYVTPVIPNPINIKLFDANKSKEPGGNGKPTIISINNGFDSRKNVTRLIRAFVEIEKSIPEARLILIGGGYEADGMAAQWAKKNGCFSENIEFMGPQEYERAMEVLAKATIMVHPSIEESFGNVLVEAMCLDVPVIGGKDSGAVPWVLDFGRAGVLVDVNNHQEIATHAIELINNSAKRSEFVEAGRAYAFEKFHPEKVANEHLKIYKEIYESAAKTTRPGSGCIG